MRKITVLLFVIFAGAMMPQAGFSLPKLGDIKNPVTNIKDKAKARLDAEATSATGMTGMNRKMMFNTLYAQIFFMGGFGAGYYELEETQGTIWRLSATDSEGTVSSVEAERALLKNLPDGSSWWYLAWRSEGEEWEFEALMDKDLLARKIRYYNEDVKRIQESEFKYSKEKADPEAETTPPEEAPASTLDFSDLQNYSKGKEKIKVSGKTFNCERIEWKYYNEEDKSTLTYTWWVDAAAAGGLIKYEWTLSNSKEMVKGELVSIEKGYKTKFKSF